MIQSTIIVYHKILSLSLSRHCRCYLFPSYFLPLPFATAHPPALPLLPVATSNASYEAMIASSNLIHPKISQSLFRNKEATPSHCHRALPCLAGDRPNSTATNRPQSLTVTASPTGTCSPPFPFSQPLPSSEFELNGLGFMLFLIVLLIGFLFLEAYELLIGKGKRKI